MEIDTKRCIELVHERGFWHSHQCTAPRKDGEYCGRHAKMHARREAERKKCYRCGDTGHFILHIPTKFHCDDCKTGCKEINCTAKE